MYINIWRGVYYTQVYWSWLAHWPQKGTIPRSKAEGKYMYSIVPFCDHSNSQAHCTCAFTQYHGHCVLKYCTWLKQFCFIFILLPIKNNYNLIFLHVRVQQHQKGLCGWICSKLQDKDLWAMAVGNYDLTFSWDLYHVWPQPYAEPIQASVYYFRFYYQKWTIKINTTLNKCHWVFWVNRKDG